MRAFVTGANGYIGYNVARALRRAGHDVWGLVRNRDHFPRLERSEIRPVLGHLQDPDSYADAVAGSTVIVHAAIDYGADPTALETRLLDLVRSTASRSVEPKTLVYTSGVWVLGDTGGMVADESTPPSAPDLVAWRPAMERRVVGETAFRGIVLRPGVVYGGQGGLTGLWFRDAQGGLVRAFGGDNRWAMVHVDDLADAYVRAAESA